MLFMQDGYRRGNWVIKCRLDGANRQPAVLCRPQIDHGGAEIIHLFEQFTNL
jgi:hypothetical protein